MKPYLESIRRLSRVALMLLVLCVTASVIMAMQFCTTEYVSNIPRDPFGSFFVNVAE